MIQVIIREAGLSKIKKTKNIHINGPPKCIELKQHGRKANQVYVELFGCAYGTGTISS